MQPATVPLSALYANDGTGKFTNVTTGSGLDVPMFGNGAACGDYVGDGDTDVFVSCLGSDHLLIIIFFGIPISIKFRKCGILQSATPIFRYLISFAVISVIAALITIGVYTFLPKQFWGYLLGILFPIIISLKKLGHNYENFTDFVENNKPYIDTERFLQFYPGFFGE